MAQLGQYKTGMGDQHLARLGRAHTAIGTDEQPHPNHRLGLLQGFRYCRLRQPDLFGRRKQAAFAGDGNYQRKLAQRKVGIKAQGHSGYSPKEYPNPYTSFDFNTALLINSGLSTQRRVMTDYPELQLFIDNQWRKTAETLPILNPATETEIGRLPVAGRAELDDALEAADRGFKIWSRTAPRIRAEIILRAASLLRDRGPLIAPSITMENGKPLMQAKMEVTRTRASFGR
jgi:hypothetical protein